MKASDYVKSKGIYSLKTLAEHYGFHADTLGRWYGDPVAKVNKLDPLIERYLTSVVEAK